MKQKAGITLLFHDIASSEIRCLRARWLHLRTLFRGKNKNHAFISLFSSLSHFLFLIRTLHALCASRHFLSCTTALFASFFLDEKQNLILHKSCFFFKLNFPSSTLTLFASHNATGCRFSTKINFHRTQTTMSAEAKSDASKGPLVKEGGGDSVPQTKKAESFFARCLRRWISTIDHVTSSFLGGPRCVKFAHVINFQKCTTIFLCIAMMRRSKNFSSTAAAYTALHGSYGLCWFMKHLVFPDPRWESKMTIGGAISVFALVLGPYWIIAYNAIMRNAERTNVELCAATVVYAVGLALMVGADVQKYFVLRERKGLIKDGFFARTRNPNYLGEVMIYGSFAYVSAHSSSWVIVGSVWTFLFIPWMLNKDLRMSRHPGWQAYVAKTGLFFPRLL